MNKSVKKIFSLMLAFLVCLTFTACGNKEESEGSSESPVSNAETASESSETKESADAPSESSETSQPETTGEFKAEEPILLTSGGQSADAAMVKTMLNKIGVQVSQENLATADNLGDNKTLIIAVGGSSKGLGAAGVDANGELDRLNALISAAKDKGLTILCMHVGGEARRGELSDKFIVPCFENANYAIVVKDGDKDSMMQNIAKDKGYDITMIDKITDAMDVLKGIFNK